MNEMDMVMEYLKQIIGTIGEQDEIFKGIAKIHKKSFDALINQGFTEEQAIKIITSQNLINSLSQGNG